jgi:hypothetical protein
MKKVERLEKFMNVRQVKLRMTGIVYELPKNLFLQVIQLDLARTCKILPLARFYQDILQEKILYLRENFKGKNSAKESLLNLGFILKYESYLIKV